MTATRQVLGVITSPSSSSSMIPSHGHHWYVRCWWWREGRQMPPDTGLRLSLGVVSKNQRVIDTISHLQSNPADGLIFLTGLKSPKSGPCWPLCSHCLINISSTFLHGLSCLWHLAHALHPDLFFLPRLTPCYSTIRLDTVWINTLPHSYNTLSQSV